MKVATAKKSLRICNAQGLPWIRKKPQYSGRTRLVDLQLDLGATDLAWRASQNTSLLLSILLSAPLDRPPESGITSWSVLWEKHLRVIHPCQSLKRLATNTIFDGHVTDPFGDSTEPKVLLRLGNATWREECMGHLVHPSLVVKILALKQNDRMGWVIKISRG